MMKIVIIDDSRIIRERLVNILTEPGLIEVVGEAASAAVGIALVHDHNPDFVILDIRMPGLCGIQALEEIKRLRPGIKIIVLTNYPYPAYSKRCFELGADYFFDKSSEFEQVKKVLSHHAKDENVVKQPIKNPNRIGEKTPEYGVTKLAGDSGL